MLSRAHAFSKLPAPSEIAARVFRLYAPGTSVGLSTALSIVTKKLLSLNTNRWDVAVRSVPSSPTRGAARTFVTTAAVTS